VLHDGVPIKGYIAWSFVDNFEWALGFTERFGLVYVDHDSPGRERYVKASACMFRDMIRANSLVRPDAYVHACDARAPREVSFNHVQEREDVCATTFGLAPPLAAEAGLQAAALLTRSEPPHHSDRSGAQPHTPEDIRQRADRAMLLVLGAGGVAAIVVVVSKKVLFGVRARHWDVGLGILASPKAAPARHTWHYCATATPNSSPVVPAGGSRQHATAGTGQTIATGTTSEASTHSKEMELL